MRTIDDICNGEPLEEVMFKAANDPGFFMERIMGYDEKPKKFHIDWFNSFLKNKRSCIIAPRGHGKTEVLGVSFFCYNALFRPGKIMILISKTLDMSKEIMRRVKQAMDSNEVLTSLKPDKFEKIWTKTEIHTTTGCVLICRPYGQNIRTWHVNYLLCDEAAFYEDKNSFYFDILPVVNTHDGNLMVISTPQTNVDLVAELAKKPMYHYKKYQAIMKGKPLWPEKFPKKKLDAIKREQGEIKYSREYMCDVMSSEAAVFPVDLIERACDDNMVMKNIGASDGIYYFGADFAMATKGNFSVYIVLKKVGNKLVLDYMERPKRGTEPKVQEQMIHDIYNRFPISFGFGDNGHFGGMVVKDLISDNLNIDGFDFQNKKEEIIINLRQKFENNNLVIPTSPDDPYTKMMSDIVIKELSEIMPFETKTGKEVYKGVGRYDDAVMALAMAVSAADQFVDVDVMIETID